MQMDLSYRLRGLHHGCMTGSFSWLGRDVVRNLMMEKPACACSQDGRHNRFPSLNSPYCDDGSTGYPMSGAVTSELWGDDDLVQLCCYGIGSKKRT